MTVAAVVPVSVTNGTIEGGATTVTIPAGSVESGPLAVTRTPGATDALIADIGTLPGLPPNHRGYAPVKSADLPLMVEAAPSPAPAVEPKPQGEVQATVEAAVEAGGGLRAGGSPVTIDMSTLFSFGAGGNADTAYTAQSSDPAVVAAETRDERLVLTPGNPLPAEASSSLAVVAANGDPARATITVTAMRAGALAEVEFTVAVDAAPPEPVPATTPLALMLLAFMLIASGAWLQRRHAHRSEC